MGRFFSKILCEVRFYDDSVHKLGSGKKYSIKGPYPHGVANSSFLVLKSIDLSVGFSLKSDFETTNKQDKAT